MGDLESAKAKIEGYIRYQNLPHDRNATLWTRIENACKLTIDELGALQNDVCRGSIVEPSLSSMRIEQLYEPNVSPSSVKSEDIKMNQLDETCYSPCANSFVLLANCYAKNLQVAMTGSDPLGYCSQKHIKEEGITCLLTSNVSKCFLEYCHCLKLGDEIEDRVSIMHKSYVNTKAGKGDIDICLFYRFSRMDKRFVHIGCPSLFPLLFIEFTKSTKKTIDEKLPKASLYANHLFRLMHFDKFLTWVPLLGIVMSENEMLTRLYSPSVVDGKWKIAEVDIMRCPLSTVTLQRLVHIMAKWTIHCSQFLCSPSAVSTGFSLNTHLLLRKESNVAVLDNKVFKAYDYRDISERSYVHLVHRRDPAHYWKSNLSGLEVVVKWNSENNPQDSLQIISYDMVPGVHYPSFVGHMILVLRKLAQLHADGIVHGDLRFSNIVFSAPNDAVVASTIIDFDYIKREASRRTIPSCGTEQYLWEQNRPTNRHRAK